MLNILIVDDDELHGRSVRDLLAAHNYPADVACSGTAGLQTLIDAAAGGHPYHALILDLHIPDLSGLEVLQGIREAGLDCKTIILSGENELSTVAPILKLGAMDYLRKPFVPDQLLNSLRNAISRYALEREHASMQLQAKENAKLYEFLLNVSPDLIYMLDPDGDFQFANQRLSSIFKVDGGTLQGQPWQSLFTHSPQLAQHLERQINERRTGMRATMAEEFEYTSELGSRHTLELSATGLYESNPDADPAQTDARQFIGTYGVIRDVTESRRTRRELMQSQRKFYSLFVDSPDAMFIANLDSGHIIERNSQFVAIRDTMGGTDDGTDSFLWGTTYRRDDFVNALRNQSTHIQWQLEHVLDGEACFFEIRARKLELEGEPCVIATVRDRTEERRAEQDRLTIQRQLQQAGRMEAIGQVAGGIAHDFNNILASIIGYAELVMNARSRLQPEQVDQYLHEVITAGHRAKDLISQMLTFTRAKRGEQKYVDVATTVADVSRMLRAAIPATIDLDTRFSEKLAPVAIDPVQLQQIVINLLINARDAITGHGAIRVSATQQMCDSHCQTCDQSIRGEFICVEVTDTGHGVDDAVISKIFDMYFTTRDPDVGTGFGLWMVNNIVHDHQGHIAVSSQKNSGSSFSIYLPVTAAEAAVAAPDTVKAPRIDGRILVVDDEVSVANFIAEVLRDQGYPTLVFTESPKALAYLENNLDKVSLLLTDGNMPLVDGAQLATFAKQNDADLPVIFITGFAQQHNPKSLGELVDKYLEKPFSIEELTDTVRDLVGAHESL